MADWEQDMASTTTLVETSPAFFEQVYAEAGNRREAIPWDRGGPSPALVNWLNAVAPTLVRCGARVAVVGCGLGHDVAELVRRGYEVTGFDCSQSAVQWARRLYASCAGSLHQADLFNLPARWSRRFDLVVEVNTIQALVPERRDAALRAMTHLMSPHGRLLVICHGAESPAHPEAGPPWPLTKQELLEAAARAGLLPEGPLSSFNESAERFSLRLRGVFTKV
jgi:SAM-dependent methyltransferase